MVKIVTVDSSVIISTLLPAEKRHEEACAVWPGTGSAGACPTVIHKAKNRLRTFCA